MSAYGEISTAFYDLDKPFAPELALAWYAEQLAARGGRALEPMCGSGRFLVPLSQRGLQLDGMDSSAPMLAACRARLGEDSGVRLWRQELHEMDLPERYDAAFIPASSFCLIAEPTTALQGLCRLREHLRPGGLLLLEFEEPPFGVSWPMENTRIVTKGALQIRLVSRADYDPATQLETYHNHYELKRSGKVEATETETLQLRHYHHDGMLDLLRQAGFEDPRVEEPAFGYVAVARTGDLRPGHA